MHQNDSVLNGTKDNKGQQRTRAAFFYVVSGNVNENSQYITRTES